MTNTDKTRQKLVNSMRKSKDAAGKKPVPKSATTKVSSPGKTSPKKKKTATAVASTKSPQESGAAAKKADATAGSALAAGDSYQGGRRVWPD